MADMKFQFSLRDLLWLTIIACIVLAWVLSNAGRKVGRYQYIAQPPAHTTL